MDCNQVLEKLRSLGLFIQDIENHISYPNNLWGKWGYTQEDMTDSGFLNFVHPDDRVRVKMTLDDFDSGGRDLHNLIFRIKDSGEHWHWILSSCLAIDRDESGHLLRYVGFDHDITQEIEARNRAEKAQKEAETLFSASMAITAHLDLSHTISAILEQAGRVLSFDSSSVQLLEEVEGDKRMKIVGGVGFSPEDKIIGLTFPMTGLTPNSRILKERELLVLDNRDLAIYTDFYDFAHRDIHCWMGVPLICRDRLLGMIAFDRVKDEPFTSDDIRLARVFAGQVAVALDNSRLYEETRKLAITDSLTGCFSRRWMYSELNKECESSFRHNHNLSFIMIDIDDFKSINDTYGHLTGDNVLKKITVLIGKVLRRSDLLCRIGGEEFIIILPYESRKSALDVAERIRDLVEKEAIVDGMTESVTISLGCTQLNEDDRENIEGVLDRVDRALYMSKRQGKNRVTPL
jgi:diguanylate cyclase (GGDEF)-like protein/PAS domain S-box-containing protein